MEKYNIVFIKTDGGEKELLGRRAEDYVIREFSDFSAKKCRIAKQSEEKTVPRYTSAQRIPLQKFAGERASTKAFFARERLF